MSLPPSLTSCEHCGGPSNWTVFDDQIWYSCKLQCDGFMQLELLPESVVQPTILREGNFPPDSEYVEHEGRESGPGGSDLLPWD